MTNQNRTALITGASAGIGAAFARHLAGEGFNLLLVARRAERLQEIANTLQGEYGIRCDVLAADLNDPAAPAAIMAFADQQRIAVDVLVNNAGLSGKTAFADTPWPTLAAEIQLMVTALTELCHRVLPGMRERGWGRIINLSSVAALSPPAASLLYTGIKSYVLNISQSLDMELKPQGIHVTALCPGFTRSEFHDVMGTRDTTDKLPALFWHEADEVARAGWQAVMEGKPVCVTVALNKLMTATVRPLPIRLQYLLGDRLNPFKE